MNCPNCGSNTPKEVSLENINVTSEIITISGYAVLSTRPIFQCKSKSCNCAFNPMLLEFE